MVLDSAIERNTPLTAATPEVAVLIITAERPAVFQKPPLVAADGSMASAMSSYAVATAENTHTTDAVTAAVARNDFTRNDFFSIAPQIIP